VSPSSSRRPPDWPITPLEALSAPARRLRAVADDATRRQVDALRAELANLVDLDAPWLRTETDPLGRFSVDEGPGFAEAPPPEPGHLGRPQATWPARGHPAGRRETRTGVRPTASGATPAGRTTDLLRSPQRSGGAARSSAPPSPTSTAPAGTPNERPEAPDARSARMRRRPPAGQATATIGPSREQTPSPATSAIAPNEQARSPEESPELAAWARRRSRPALFAAARTPIGGPGLPRRRLAQRAMGDAQAAERTSSPQPQRGEGEAASPAGEETTGRPSRKDAAFQQHAAPPMPSANLHLLAQLTERWFAARQTNTAPGRPSGLPAPELSPPGPGMARSPHAHTRPSPRGIISSLEEALQPSEPGDPTTWQWISPIAGAAAPGANGAVPVASNTIHLTVQPPPSLETLDPDELADLLGQILRREARRYGIPMV